MPSVELKTLGKQYIYRVPNRMHSTNPRTLGNFTVSGGGAGQGKATPRPVETAWRYICCDGRAPVGLVWFQTGQTCLERASVPDVRFPTPGDRMSCLASICLRGLDSVSELSSFLFYCRFNFTCVDVCLVARVACLQVKPQRSVEGNVNILLEYLV